MPEKQHSANHLALGKEPVSGSEKRYEALYLFVTRERRNEREDLETSTNRDSS